jgi:hypothetical protein
MRKIVLVVLASFMLAGLASAQIPTSGNVFFGYSYETASSTALNVTPNRANLQGWEASLEGKMARWFGIVADFSGHYGSQSFTELTPTGPFSLNVTGHEFEVMFGPRVSIPVGKFTPFGEFLAGVGHMSTGGSAFASSSGPGSTSFATAFGGGLDYRVVRLVALRAEGDFVHTSFFSNGQNNFRLSTGVVVRF